MTRFLLAGFCLTTVVACTNSTPLSQRYAEVECVDLVAGGTNLCAPDTFAVTLDVFSSPIDPPPSRTALDLAGEGQQAYITETAKWARAKSSAELAAALAVPITRSIAANEPIDKTKFQRRISYSIAKDRYRIGDRIVFAKLDILPTELRFTKWSRAETQYATYDQALLTNTTTTTIGAEAGLDLAAMISQLVDFKLSASRQNVVGQELQLRQRVEDFTPVFRPELGTIIRVGEAGIDLSGTAFIDVELVFPDSANFTFTRLSSASGLYAEGKVTAPSEAVLVRRDVKHVQVPEDIVGKATLTHVVREILQGKDTIEESDDLTRFVARQAEEKSFVLLPSEDIRLATWTVTTSDRRSPMFYQDPSEPKAAILFPSFEEAERFRQWLLTTGSSRIGAVTVGFSEIRDGRDSFVPLKSTEIPRLVVRVVDPRSPV